MGGGFCVLQTIDLHRQPVCITYTYWLKANFSTIEFILAIEKGLAALNLSTLLHIVLTRRFHSSVNHQVIRFSLRNRSTAIRDRYHIGLVLRDRVPHLRTMVAAEQVFGKQFARRMYSR